mgnify:CR=1 FL=1
MFVGSNRSELKKLKAQMSLRINKRSGQVSLTEHLIRNLLLNPEFVSQGFTSSYLH